MRPFVTAAVVAAFGAAFLHTDPAQAETVALVTASPSSEAAARYFSTQTELPVVRRQSHNSRDLDALVGEARTSWPEALVVVLDADRAVVSVLRPGDGTVGSRRLDAPAAAAPYAVALAAAELLEIVRDAPSARAAALVPTVPPPLTTRWVIGLEVLETVSINGDVGLVRPAAGVDLDVSPRASSLWLGIGLHVSGLVPLQRDQVLVLPNGPDDHGRLEYERNELSLRVALGQRYGRAEALGYAEGGVAFIDVKAIDHRADLVAEDNRATPWFGFGAELRYRLWAGVSLGVGAGLAWLPSPSSFYTSPPGPSATVPALAEGSVEIRARAGFAWSSGL